MKSAFVLGTPLQITTYAELTAALQERSRQPGPCAVDFTNTHIVTLRRHDPEFRELTSRFDYFVPDGMPLVWCLNRQGAGLRDRVYGPTFMRECVTASPAPFTHYFLGGSEECVQQLKSVFLARNPSVKIVGARNGYFGPEDEPAILDEINALSPDFLWLGLGTPKQQKWIHENKARLRRGVILAVGFAFDVNAGTKTDSPMWMQRRGLGWLHRMASEPGRLVSRYFKYNLLFLWLLCKDGVRGRAWSAPVATGK